MASNGRIYVVENDESLSLVRAVSPTKAVNHVVKESYQVRVATADDVAKYMAQGATVEDSTIEIGNQTIVDPELAVEGDGQEDVPV